MTMLLGSSLASRFRLARTSIYRVARSFGGSGNSAAQEESPLKDFEYNIPKELLPCKIENPACDVIQDDWAIVRGFKYNPVVCRALYQEGYKALSAGVNSKDMYRGVRMAMVAVDKYLRRIALKIRQKKEIVQLTTIVSDRTIGELIAKGVEKVGYDGLLVVMPDKKMGNALEFDNGMQLCWSFASPHHPYFNDLETSTSSVENPFILIVEHKSFNRNVVEQAIKSTNYKRPLLIVTEKADMDLVESIERDRESLGIQVYIIDAMVDSVDNNAILQDLAIFTGGQVVTEVSDMNPIPSMLGSCREVRIADSKIVVIGGSGTQESIEKRCQQMLSTIRRSELNFETMLLQDRLAGLSRGAAIYKAGVVQTVEESHKNYLRVSNSVHAASAGIKEGIIPGGGVALVHASKELDKLQVENSGQKYGVRLFQHVLKMPVYSIASTAGFDGLTVVEKILEQEDIDFGYDPAKGEYVHMIKSGNMDPYKLVSSELCCLVRNFSTEMRSRFSDIDLALGTFESSNN